MHALISATFVLNIFIYNNLGTVARTITDPSRRALQVYTYMDENNIKHRKEEQQLNMAKGRRGDENVITNKVSSKNWRCY